MSEGESEQKPIWERLKGESNRCYYAFTLYRNMGPTRSLAKVSEQMQNHKQEYSKKPKKPEPALDQNRTKTVPKISTLKYWLAKYNWTSRAEAWDAEQDKIALLELQQAQKEAAKRHVDLGKILQAKGAIRLKQLNPEINPEDLSPMAALKYIETGVKIERQILGEPDQVVKHTGNIEVQAEWVTRMEAEQHQASEEFAPTSGEKVAPP
jgi:hypothetical protein